MEYLILQARDHCGCLKSKLVHANTYARYNDPKAFFGSDDTQMDTVENLGVVDITGAITMFDEIYDSKD